MTSLRRSAPLEGSLAAFPGNESLACSPHKDEVLLIQVLLPLYDEHGARFPIDILKDIERELTSRFGGVTAFSRSPAHGRWMDEEGRIEHDEVIVCEVMVSALDRDWWREYKTMLASRLRQTELVIRCMPIELL